MMLILDGEVVNGGFHQLMWNSEGSYNEAIDEALAYFGFGDIREIFQRAIECANEHDIVETKRRGENTWEEFTDGYQTIPWKPIDEAYWQQSPTLFARVAKYLREHPNEFQSTS